ncbi:MAG: glycosyltransferase family 39 protein [Bacteroidota bacterium]
MLKKLRPYLILMLVFTAVLVVLQWQMGIATQPYFWDEMGVYAPAAIHLYEHGIGILPGDLPDILSRGHPTLFPLVVAIAFKLFGCTPFVAHVTCYALYFIGICFLYRILQLWTDWRLALTVAVAIGLQPCFISQSIIVLPEILLMTLAIAAVYYAMVERWVAVSIILCLAVMVKESALVLPLALWLALLINKRSFKASKPLLLLAVPYGLFGLFLVIQKLQNGYFFFPLHTSLMHMEWYFIKERLLLMMDFIFNDQGRGWFFIATVALFLFGIFKWWGYVLSVFKGKSLHLLVLLVVLAGGIAFTGLNFFLSRYILFFLIFAYALCFMLLFQFGKLKKIWSYLLCGYLLFNTVYSLRNTHYTDVDFSYVPHVQTSLQACEYMANDSRFKGQHIAMSFPLIAATYNHQFGYPDLKKNSYTHDFPSTLDTTMDYLVFIRPGNDNFIDSFKMNLIHDTTFKAKDAFVSIYKVRK